MISNAIWYLPFDNFLLHECEARVQIKQIEKDKYHIAREIAALTSLSHEIHEIPTL